MKPAVEARPTWACALAPLGFLVLLATTILHLRLGLGRFPEPMRDDYTAPAFRFHVALTHGLGVGVFLGVPALWLLLMAFPRFRTPPGVFARQFAVFLAGWGIFFAFAVADPARLVSWYLD